MAEDRVRLTANESDQGIMSPIAAEQRIKSPKDEGFPKPQTGDTLHRTAELLRKLFKVPPGEARTRGR